jgi:hypothetical protein
MEATSVLFLESALREGVIYTSPNKGDETRNCEIAMSFLRSLRFLDISAREMEGFQWAWKRRG